MSESSQAITDSTTPQGGTQNCAKRPNASLSEAEREAKRQLKKRLKQRMRLNKCEIRLKQAIYRNDTEWIKRATKELEEFRAMMMEEECETTAAAENGGVSSAEATRSSELDARPMNPKSNGALKFIRSIYQDLVLRLKDRQSREMQHIAPSTTATTTTTTAKDREAQSTEARKLLHSMSKGTQTESMFDNRDALLGYTRQKFTERAILIVSSLDQLNSYKVESTQTIWEKLLATKAICSIGCGPGCDAIGALAFISSYNDNCSPVVDRLILLDFVLPKWKEYVLNPLKDLLLLNHVSQIDMATCDIRTSLITADINQVALRLLQQSNANEATGNMHTGNKSDVDLILVSYVITETRGQWQRFFLDLLANVPSGTLLVVSEPTAWQLHQLLHICGDWFACHEWLDSSRSSPELQPLEGRIGPAVLIACVK